MMVERHPSREQFSSGGTSRSITGTCSQTGQCAPGCPSVEPGENGWMPLDAHIRKKPYRQFLGDPL